MCAHEESMSNRWDMFTRLLANLEAVSVRFDSSHRGPDSTNRIRLVSEGLVMARYLHTIAFVGFVGPAISDHLIHLWSKSVADPCLRFSKASVLVLTTENPGHWPVAWASPQMNALDLANLEGCFGLDWSFFQRRVNLARNNSQCDRTDALYFRINRLG